MLIMMLLVDKVTVSQGVFYRNTEILSSLI